MIASDAMKVKRLPLGSSWIRPGNSPSGGCQRTVEFLGGRLRGVRKYLDKTSKHCRVHCGVGSGGKSARMEQHQSNFEESKCKVKRLH